MDKKLKIALAQLNPLVGDVSGNIDKLISIRAGLKDDVDTVSYTHLTLPTNGEV